MKTKEVEVKLEEDEEKYTKIEFYTRLSFWLMVIAYAIYIIIIDTEFYFDFGIATLIFSISSFILSIIHLVKIKKKKALAIVALVISSYLILTFIIGMVYGILLYS